MEATFYYLILLVMMHRCTSNENHLHETKDLREDFSDDVANMDSLPDKILGMKTSNSDTLVESKAQHILSMHTGDGGCPFAQSGGGCPFANQADQESKHTTSTSTSTLSHSGGSMDDCNEKVGEYPMLPEPNRTIHCVDLNKTRYRTIDGTCNNLKHPTWGSALHPFKRILPPRYEKKTNDTYNYPVGSTGMKYNEVTLPLARSISFKAVASKVEDNGDRPDPNNNDDADLTRHWIVISWGQFSDHGITHTPHVMDCKCKCNETTIKKGCYPINIPDSTTVSSFLTNPTEKESEFINRPKSCIQFGRSKGSVFNKIREQFSDVSMYMDGSQVYGSDMNKSERLRRTGTPFMRVNNITTIVGQRELLPNGPDNCTQSGTNKTSHCMFAGDVRANIQPTLTTIHTLFLREHNRIAGVLKRMNPKIKDETIFQETRKIIGAIIQHIQYRHYLPLVLIDPVAIPDKGFSMYKRDVDATLVNEFSTAAFRFAHGNIFKYVYHLEKGATGGPSQIFEGGKDLFALSLFATREIFEKGIDPFIHGMLLRYMKKSDGSNMASKEIINCRNFDNGMGFDDLSSRNIQRGRDHGLPSYADYLRHYEFIEGKLHNWADLDHIIPKNAKSRLAMIYNHPENIDLWVGGLAEYKDTGLVGKLFNRILKDQFQKLFEGDRFFYTHENVFEKDQLEALRKVTLAQIICHNNDGTIKEVPENVFKEGGKKTQCKNFPKLDLKPWGQLKD